MIDPSLIRRIGLAISFLKDGAQFSVAGYGLSHLDHKTMSVSGSSNFYFIQNITRDKAFEEFKQIICTAR